MNPVLSTVTVTPLAGFWGRGAIGNTIHKVMFLVSRLLLAAFLSFYFTTDTLQT